MDKGQMLKDLPADILLKIQSYLLGEPDYLKIKYSNALKRLQSKYFTKQLSNSMTVNGFPSWEWRVVPPRPSIVRRVFTHHLKNQVHQIKALIDNPDYFNDGGILLEVEYYNQVGFLQKKRIIPSEDKIETVMASICKDYIDDDLITSHIDKKETLQSLRIELHTSREVIENKTRRRRRRNQ